METRLVPHIHAYNALKEAHPEELVGIQNGGYCLFYGEDAKTAFEKMPVSWLLPADLPGIGQVTVAGIREGGQEAVARVLAHEVLHTCYGCANHGPRWKGYAQRMNDAYGYAIRRTDDYASLGLEDDRPVRYYVVCQRCARRIPRMKRSPLVDHPERYRCPCGGTLRVEEGGAPYPENGKV